MLRISKKLGNKEQEAEARNVLAKLSRKEGNYQERKKCTTEFPPVEMKLGNGKQEAKSCEILAKSSRKEGHDKKSGKCSQALPIINNKLGNKEHEVRAYDHNVGRERNCFREEGNDQKSRK